MLQSAIIPNCDESRMACCKKRGICTHSCHSILHQQRPWYGAQDRCFLLCLPYLSLTLISIPFLNKNVRSPVDATVTASTVAYHSSSSNASTIPSLCRRSERNREMLSRFADRACFSSETASNRCLAASYRSTSPLYRSWYSS